ncbi:MAG: PEP-CTERM sorting domain-containing protein [Planctomycetota bacterium]
MKRLNAIFIVTVLTATLVPAAIASGTLYLENYNIDDDPADAGWYQDNSWGIGATARVETWSQSDLRTPEGINNDQQPAHNTDAGFFASSGYDSLVYTDEYDLSLDAVTGWGLDAMNKRESPRELYFMAEVDGVRWVTAPIAVIGDGEDDAEWRTYHEGFEPDSVLWQSAEGDDVAEGLFGQADAFGFAYRHDGEGNLYVDNFTIVPEPMTLGLLAVGGLGVVIGRKR